MAQRVDRPLERRPELDALRGFFLVWMTLTHLPTHLSDFVNSTMGFVSSAEGFIFISAFLVGRIYIRKAIQDGAAARRKLWKRTLKIYGYQLAMLALVFTIVAPLAVHTHKAAIYNLLDFYIAHRVTAIIGSVLLLYCPPLLDILPMYVIFLFLTPLVLSGAVRRGWKWVLAASGGVWLLAQFGLRDWAYHGIFCLLHLQIPIHETGSFDLFAWQALWIVGLWLGARSAMHERFLPKIPAWAAALCCGACLFFVGVRWGWFGPYITENEIYALIDKWRIGPLRVVNLTAFSLLGYWMRARLMPWLMVKPLLTLGKASLHVFCAHLVFVFVGLSLLLRHVGQDAGAPAEQLHGLQAALLVIGTFVALYFVARREVRQQRATRARRAQTAVAPSPG